MIFAYIGWLLLWAALANSANDAGNTILAVQCVIVAFLPFLWLPKLLRWLRSSR